MNKQRQYSKSHEESKNIDVEVGEMINDNGEFSSTEPCQNETNKEACKANGYQEFHHGWEDEDAPFVDVAEDKLINMDKHIPKNYDWSANWSERHSTSLVTYAAKLHAAEADAGLNLGKEELKLFDKSLH